MEINKTYNGDCLELMPQIQDKSIDMILCDLPYGTTACSWDTIIPLEPLWKQYKRIIKDNGAIVLTASQPFTSVLVMSNIKYFKYEWVWVKNRHSNFLNSKYMPRKFHENVLVFYRKQPTYNAIKVSLAPATVGRNNRSYSSIIQRDGDGQYSKAMPSVERKGKKQGQPKSIIYCNLEQNNQYKKKVFHPTQKPVELFEYLIRTYTNENELVLDNCSGSGTTAIACINTNRNYILIEKDKGYFEIANKRINEHKAQLKLF